MYIYAYIYMYKHGVNDGLLKYKGMGQVKVFLS